MYLFRVCLYDFLFIIRKISRRICIFQFFGRKFYYNPCMDLPFFIFKYHFNQHIKRPWENKYYVFHRNIKPLSSHWVYIFRRSKNRDSWIFIWTSGKSIVHYLFQRLFFISCTIKSRYLHDTCFKLKFYVLTSRMEFLINVSYIPCLHFYIHLCGRNIRMSHHFLYRLNICAIFQKMCSK